MKKKVIIIEDNKMHFEVLKRYLSDTYNVYPKFDEDLSFEDFGGLLDSSFNGGDFEDESRELIKKKLHKDFEISEFNRDFVDLFIIDYQLKDECTILKVTGKHFYNHFVRDLCFPTLFITKMDIPKKSTRRMVVKETSGLTDFISDENTRLNCKIIDLLPKEEDWKENLEFGDKLKKRIEILISNRTHLDSDFPILLDILEP